MDAQWFDAGFVDMALDVQPDASKGTLALNEVMYAPVGDGVDWIEFIALGSEPLNLAEYAVIDDHPDHERVSLPEMMLQPGDFYVMKKHAESGGLPFGLGRRDGIRLYRNESLVSQIDWQDDNAPEGTTYGRVPDGTGDWQTTAPTPGQPNQAADLGEIPSTEIFPQDRVLEVELILSEDAWNAILSDPLAEEYHAGSINFDGTRVDDVAIRVKGNSTLNAVARSNSERFSFKVDINRYVPGQRLRGAKKLNFNNGFKDPTLMREYLGYDLLTRAGMTASRTAFVNLFVAGRHMGLYTMVEQVDDQFLERHFDDDTGDLYKPEPPAGLLLYRGPTLENYENIRVKNNEDSTDHSAFLSFISILNGERDGALEDIMDVETVLRNLALNVVMVNLDSYLGMGHNFYLYERDGQFVDIPWDLNETFGNFTCGCDRNGLVNFKIDEPTCGALNGRPLIAVLLSNPNYRDRYHQMLEDIIEGPASADAMAMRIQSTAQMIRPYVAQDPTKFFSMEDFERGLQEDVRGGGVGLASFMRDRNDAIRRQLSGQDPSTHQGNGNCGQGRGGMMGGGGQGGRMCPPCGDGICDPFETQNPNVCPRDCREPPANGDWCGDGLCDALENCERSCPEDCAS